MAVNEKYIEFMVNKDTDSMEDTVPTVLDYLFTTYGKITAEEVKDLENSCLNISFNPVDPMVTIFRLIKQLQKKANEVGILYSEQQLIKFGPSLIRNTQEFLKAPGEWNKKLQRVEIGKNNNHIFAQLKLNLRRFVD